MNLIQDQVLSMAVGGKGDNDDDSSAGSDGGVSFVVAPGGTPLATAGFDFEAAHREGWTVAEAEPNTDGTPGMQLQRLDTQDGTAPTFPGDQDAWVYVVVRARAGSERHRQALTLLDPCERFLIEAACGPI